MDTTHAQISGQITKMADFRRYYDNASLSDVKLILGSGSKKVSFNGHKVILSANSDELRERFEAPTNETDKLQLQLLHYPVMAMQRFLKCLYGFPIDILEQHYGAEALKARGQQVPTGCWSSDWEENLNYLGVVQRSPEFYPRLCKAASEILELYMVAKTLKAKKICDAQVQQIGKVLSHVAVSWCLKDPEEGHPSNEVVDEIVRFAKLFKILYPPHPSPLEKDFVEDRMRQTITCWVEKWESIFDSAPTLYEAIPGLHVDVLRERRRQQQEKQRAGRSVETMEVEMSGANTSPRRSWLGGAMSRLGLRASVPIAPDRVETEMNNTPNPASPASPASPANPANETEDAELDADLEITYKEAHG